MLDEYFAICYRKSSGFISIGIGVIEADYTVSMHIFDTDESDDLVHCMDIEIKEVF